MLFLDLETRGGLKDFTKIQMLVGGAIEVRRRYKYQFERDHFEHWVLQDIEKLERRLLEFDGLIIGMNLYGYDYRVLSRYFDVSPLIAKTLDFQHTLWRIGGGPIGMGALAKNNLRRRKVPGSNMATLWDLGDKAHVLKRNRVDCELTADLYFRFLDRGMLAGGRGGIQLDCSEDRGDVENLLVAAGAMSQYSSDEYAWRIQHHNGVRGDRRFTGRAWIESPQYDRKQKALFFRAECPGCGSHTLICMNQQPKAIEWLSTLRCENCSAAFNPPVVSWQVKAEDAEYSGLVRKHLEYQQLRSSLGYRPSPAPKTFKMPEEGGSFELITTFGCFGWRPIHPVERRIETYGLTENELRNALTSTLRKADAPNSNRWVSWHPTTDYWKHKTARQCAQP